MTLSDRLRRTLEARSMTITEIAERAGMSRQHVHQIVSGSNPRPNIEIVEKLAASIGVTMAELYADDAEDLDALAREERRLTKEFHEKIAELRTKRTELSGGN